MQRSELFYIFHVTDMTMLFKDSV